MTADETPPVWSPAHKGDIFGCKNGHPVCEAIDNIPIGTMEWATRLGNWRGIVPPLPGQQPLCSICGEPVRFDRALMPT